MFAITICFSYKSLSLEFPCGAAIKDLVLLVRWLGSLLWHGFNTWPGSFHMSQVWAKKKNKQKPLTEVD